MGNPSKKIEVTFIEEKIILIEGETWHHSEHSLNTIINKLNQVLMTQAEEVLFLQNLTAQAEKSKTEILAKISDLETAVTNSGNTSPEVDAALNALKDSVQGVDDIVPDAPAQP